MLGSLAIDIPAGRDSTALGVFFRFQVSDANLLLRFFSLCHFIFLSISGWFVVCDDFPISVRAPEGAHLLAMQVLQVLVAALVLVAVLAKALVAADGPALGIFFRFQVSDFDRLLGFFSLCHFIFPSYFGLVCRVR